MRKVLKIIEKIIMIISIIAVLNGILIAFLYSHKNEDNSYKFGDYYLISISNKELKDFKIGDLIIVNSKNPREYQKNNKVSYYVADSQGNISTKMGKIVESQSNNESTLYIFMVISDYSDEMIPVSGGDIIGVWVGKNIQNGGKILNFVVSRVGLLICTVCPLVLLFMIEFILLIYDYLHRNKKIMVVKGDL